MNIERDVNSESLRDYIYLLKYFLLFHILERKRQIILPINKK